MLWRLIVGALVLGVGACACLAGTLPAAPKIGPATAGDGSITVSFEPEALGPVTLVEYAVICNTTIQSGSASPITVQGLTNGLLYGCRVRVTTTAGTSPWSKLSNPVTPEEGPAARASRKRRLVGALALMAAGAIFLAARQRARRRASGEARWAQRVPVAERLSRGLLLAVLCTLWFPVAFAVGTRASGFPVADPAVPLIGVVQNRAQVLVSLPSLLDGKFQKWLALSAAEWVPFYASISRWFNEAQFMALRISSNREIMVGRENYLFHPIYASNYCHRDIHASQPAMRAWARTIAEIQTEVERRGQAFLFVLTPSKIEHMPDRLPLGYPCNAPDRDMFVSEAKRHLDGEGVHYVDASLGLDQVQRRYGYEPFPKGGIHWTDLAAHGPANAVLEQLNHLSGQQIALPFGAQAMEAAEASHEDQDFAHLMNLKWLPSPNKTAKLVKTEPQTQACPTAHSIVAVGGSFLTALARNLARAPCAAEVRHLSYFVLGQYRYAEGMDTPGFELEDKDMGILKTADAIILEENIGILLKASHVSAFHRFLKTGVLPPATF